MKATIPGRLALGLLMALSMSAVTAAPVITNGGFESGFTGWTLSDQAGGDGSFFIQSGAQTPLGGVPVPSPPEGSNAAMTDAGGPGAHVLYQDFVAMAGTAVLNFELFILNDGGEFESPDSLQFDLTNAIGEETQNQQVRVDILLASAADPFSVDVSDVLANLYLSQPNDPLVSGYTALSSDLTSLMSAYDGQTLRLRFAATDNLGPLNVGVDNVRFTGRNVVPEPGSLLLIAGALTALAGAAALRRRR